MCPVAVVVAYIFVHQTFEMPLVENNDAIEQISATATDEALGDSVLPWTVVRSYLSDLCADCYFGEAQ